MNPDEIVREFCAAWGRADLDHIMNAFSENAVYHNIPMAPCEGKAAIKGFIESFLGSNPDGIDFVIKHQISKGNLVFNERVDTLTVADKRVSLPVCGVFEIDDEGKVSAWRDYFDMAAFTGS